MKLKNDKYIYYCIKIIMIKKTWLIIFIVLNILLLLFGLYQPIINSKIVDDGLIGADYTMMYKLIIVNVLLVIIIQVVDITLQTLLNKMDEYIGFRLMSKSLKHYIKMNNLKRNKKSYQEFLEIIQTDTNNITYYVVRVILNSIKGLFTFLGSLIGLMYICKEMVIVLILLIPIKILLLNSIAMKKKTVTEKCLDSAVELSKFYADWLPKAKMINLYNLETKFKIYYKNNIKSKIKYNLDMNYYTYLMGSVEGIMMTIITMSIYITGVHYLRIDAISVGNIFAFSTFSFKIISPINQMLKLNLEYKQVEPSIKRFNEYMQISEERIGGDFIQQIQKIEISKLKFSYTNQEELFNDFSCMFEKGRIYGIVGKNGGGKSTLIDLLMGFLDSDKNSIKINDINIQNVNLTSYRKRIAYAGQDVNIFNTNFYNNITVFGYYKLNNIDQIWIDKLITNFFNKFNIKQKSINGFNDNQYSSGEKQKISLIRAFLADRDLLILDEAMTNIDEQSCELYWEYINYIKDNKIVLLISHNPNDYKRFDEVIYI